MSQLAICRYQMMLIGICTATQRKAQQLLYPVVADDAKRVFSGAIMSSSPSFKAIARVRCPKRKPINMPTKVMIPMLQSQMDPTLMPFSPQFNSSVMVAQNVVAVRERKQNTLVKNNSHCIFLTMTITETRPCLPYTNQRREI